jgi:hypothetical protein
LKAPAEQALVEKVKEIKLSDSIINETKPTSKQFTDKKVKEIQINDTIINETKKISKTVTDKKSTPNLQDKLSILHINYTRINETENFICNADYNQANLITDYLNDNVGYQCSAICVTAMAYTLHKFPNLWNSSDLNQILNFGNEYYHSCLNHVIKTKKYHNHNLTIDEVVGFIKIKDQELYISSLTTNENLFILNKSFTIANLNVTFEYFKNNFVYGAFLVNLYTYGIIFLNDSFYLFNSHATSTEGLTQADGTASIVKFNCISSLTQLISNLHTPNNLTVFSLEPIKIELIEVSKFKRDHSITSDINLLPKQKKSGTVQKIVTKLSRDLSDFSISSILPEPKKTKNTHSNLNILDTFAEIYEKIQTESFNNFDKLKQILYDNAEHIVKYINVLRNSKKNCVFSDQVIDNDYNDLIKLNAINDILIAVFTHGDGNCCYRAFSNVIYGNQYAYKAFRICICFILIEYHEYFGFQFLIHEGSNLCIKKYILKHSRDKEWANDYILQAASMLFDRPVISFFFTSANKSYHIYNNDKITIKNPICIIYSENHRHFTALLQKSTLDNQLSHWILNTNSVYKYLQVISYVESVIIFSYTMLITLSNVFNF